MNVATVRVTGSVEAELAALADGDGADQPAARRASTAVGRTAVRMSVVRNVTPSSLLRASMRLRAAGDCPP